MSVFLVEVWLTIAIAAVAVVVGLVAVIDLAFVREVDLGTGLCVATNDAEAPMRGK